MFVLFAHRPRKIKRIGRWIEIRAMPHLVVISFVSSWHPFYRERSRKMSSGLASLKGKKERKKTWTRQLIYGETQSSEAMKIYNSPLLCLNPTACCAGRLVGLSFFATTTQWDCGWPCSWLTMDIERSTDSYSAAFALLALYLFFFRSPIVTSARCGRK